MKQAFLDTNIVLDLLAERHPFYQAASFIFTLAECSALNICVSSLTFSHVHSILRKKLGNAESRRNLKKLKRLVTVLAVDERVIERALSSELPDFEDAIQCAAAEAGGMEYLITRNEKDFKGASLIVCSAEDYVRIWNAAQG